jgi:hypothetical protein
MHFAIAVSALIAAGVDVVKVSRRHHAQCVRAPVQQADDSAAIAIEATLGKL